MRRIPELDGLRGVCALTVAISHITGWALDRSGAVPALNLFARSAADLSVIIFFVLSGLVIGLNENSLTARTDYLGYAIRRVTRIYPIYVLGLCAGFLVSGIPLISLDFAKDLVFGQMWITPDVPGNSSLWSLHYEALFYALYPIVFFSRLPALRLALCLCVGSVFLFLSSNHLLVVAAYFSLWLLGLWLSQSPRLSTSLPHYSSLLVPLALTLVAYFVANPLSIVIAKVAPPVYAAAHLPHPLSAVAVGLPVALLVAASYGAIRRRLGLALGPVFAAVALTVGWAAVHHLFWMPTYQVAAGTLVVAILAGLSKVRLRLSSDILVRIGDISYGLYVFHAPIVLFILSHTPAKTPWYVYVVLGIIELALSMAVAWGAERVIQPRISRWVRRTLPAARQRGEPHLVGAGAVEPPAGETASVPK
jgi:peptidoglycan/LPS O-acetylase OafA/YrhL